MTALITSVAETGKSEPKREPSVRRKRLHILYLVNDLLYHAKFRVKDASICGKLQPILMNLLGSAASFTNCPKHQRKIVDLLALWEEKGYYSKDYVEKLREAVKNASELGSHMEGSNGASAGIESGSAARNAKTAPFVMPAMHGDPSTPWFDLPAANLMPHIEPNSTRPIKPEMIKPLQLVAGPADASLVNAVKSLLDDVQKIFGGGDQDEKATWDIDQLGQPIILDEITGDILEGEGYYGWSHGFCEKIKRRRKGLDKPDQEDRGRQSQSRSRSRSLSLSPIGKRRRYSDSGSESNPRRSNARRRYSSSRSRSRSPEQRPGFSRQRSRSRSYSASPRRSRSPPQRTEPRSTAETGVPPRAPLDSRAGAPQFPQPPFPIPNPAAFQGQFPQPPPPPFNMGQNQTYGWNNAPPPPPPPPNYPHASPNPSGQWPPPPPPGPPPFNIQQQQQSYRQQPNYPQPPNFQQNLNYQQHPNFQQQGGFPIPPLPPPNGWQQQQQTPPNGRGQHNNQSGWNGAQGRGGRGNYSGRGGW